MIIIFLTGRLYFEILYSTGGGRPPRPISYHYLFVGSERPPEILQVWKIGEKQDQNLRQRFGGLLQKEFRGKREAQAMKPRRLIYKVGEVASMFRVTPFTVYRWVYQGRLKAIKSGKMVRITEGDLLEFKRNYSSRPLKSLERLGADVQRMGLKKRS